MSNKKGIIVVQNLDNEVIFKIRRADGQFINLDRDKISNSEVLLKNNEKECEYFKNKTTLIVWIDGVKTYDQETESNKDNPNLKSPKKQYSAQMLKDIVNKEVKQEESSTYEEQQIIIHKDSFDINKALTPKYSSSLIQALKNENVDNFNLKLNKLSRFEEDKFDYTKSKFKFFDADKGRVNYQIKSYFGNFNFSEFCIEQNIKTKKLCSATDSKEFKIDWKLTIGLGNDSIYETSISLHHIYGIPFIPSSGIKGIVRSWYILDNYGLDKQAEKNAKKEKIFCDIFGSDEKSYYNEARQGKIIFFDAFPTSNPNVETDIMNSHYPEYYGGTNNQPTDTQNPNPVLFLTVKDCSFQFIIGIRNLEDKGLLETATELLKEALTQKGIGAKTAVGYGYMSENK